MARESPQKSRPEQSGRAQRADARRNVAAILAAGETCLMRDPEATMAGIASEAGVGRMTLYGHFPKRADLVDAVFEEVNARANAVIDDVAIDGEPREALRRLIAASWQVVHQFRTILAAAEKELEPERIRAHHDQHADRLADLMERGRRAGTFRTDVPVSWLVTVCQVLMHTAASDVRAGRLDPDEAERVVTSTVDAACVVPPR